jgi:hypothetical protein
VLLNDGTGGFGTPAPHPGGTGGFAITCYDVTCNGYPDVLTANLVSDDITLFPNLGSAVFGTPVAMPIGSNPSSVVVCELGGNAAPELAAAYRQGVKTVVNACPSPACDTTSPVMAVPLTCGPTFFSLSIVLLVGGSVLLHRQRMERNTATSFAR